MKKKTHILCPEYVPFDNKGEEAIIRGVIDVVFSNNAEYCEYHVVDWNSQVYYKKDNIHFHPVNLFFSIWRTKEFGLGLSWNEIYSSSCSILRNGLNKFFPWWITKPHRQAKLLKKYISGEKKVPIRFKESIEQLRKVDYIIAGHNGGLNEYVCHVINELYRNNLRYGIFGCSMKPRLHNKTLIKVFEKTFKNSDFNIARNPIGYRWALDKFPHLEFDEKPDPAFGMLPIKEELVDKLIEDLNLNTFFQKPVLMITTAEPAPIARHAFDEYTTSSQKIAAHRQFLADLLSLIHSNLDVNILFLPHTIGPDEKMDDRLISKDIVKKASLENDPKIIVLEADLTAKELKGLIGKADFLLAERIHSIIGSIGVETPFLNLASNYDTRAKGILDEQMGLGNNIYYLNMPDVESAFNKFVDLYSQKEDIKIKLRNLNKKISQELNQAGKVINNKMNL